MRDSGEMRIAQAVSAAEVAAAGELLAEYFAWLGVGEPSLRTAEVESLPGEYAPPGGLLLLASRGPAWGVDRAGEPAGCVALRRLEEGICELKRLYVRPELRGTGLGCALAWAAIEEARRMGYERVRLDTLPWMGDALSLYRRMGFSEIPPYRASDISGLVFFELRLAAHGERLEPNLAAPSPASPQPTEPA